MPLAPLPSVPPATAATIRSQPQSCSLHHRHCGGREREALLHRRRGLGLPPTGNRQHVTGLYPACNHRRLATVTAMEAATICRREASWSTARRRPRRWCCRPFLGRLRPVPQEGCNGRTDFALPQRVKPNGSAPGKRATLLRRVVCACMLSVLALSTVSSEMVSLRVVV